MADKKNCWKLVPLERSYDMRARAIIAFNTATAAGADRDDALQAAWEAAFHVAPAPSTGPDTDIEALFEGRAVNTPVISANCAVNIERAQIIARAVQFHGRAWPEHLTSGVLFYEGERITKAEFPAEAQG